MNSEITITTNAWSCIFAILLFTIVILIMRSFILSMRKSSSSNSNDILDAGMEWNISRVKYHLVNTYVHDLSAYLHKKHYDVNPIPFNHLVHDLRLDRSNAQGMMLLLISLAILVQQGYVEIDTSKNNVFLKFISRNHPRN